MKKISYLFWISPILMLFVSCTPKVYTPLFPKGYFDTRYEGLLNEGDSILKSRYQYVQVKTKDNQYVKRIYFPETKQITSEVTYRSAQFKQRHGISRTWMEDGTPYLSVPYKNGKRTGVEKKYYKDGSFTENGFYKNGYKEGVWYNFDHKKRMLSQITYANGIRDGAFIVYDTLGQITNKGYYRADTVFEQTHPPVHVDRLMAYIEGCQPIKHSNILDPCSEKKLLRAIYKNIRYPTKSLKFEVQGRAIVSFMIDQNGEMTNFKVIRGIDASITAELKRLFEDLRTKLTWRAGVQDGAKVPVQYAIPIKFKID